MRNRGGLVHGSRCSGHASTPVGNALRSQGHPHRTKRARILATLKQNESMYKNTSGYVHRWVKPWTGVWAPQGNRHSFRTKSQPQVAPPQWHAGTEVQKEPTDLPGIYPRTLPRERRPAQPRVCSEQSTLSGAKRQLPLCSSDGTSQLPSEPEISPRQYPLGARG